MKKSSIITILSIFLTLNPITAGNYIHFLAPKSVTTKTIPQEIDYPIQKKHANKIPELKKQLSQIAKDIGTNKETISFKKAFSIAFEINPQISQEFNRDIHISDYFLLSPFLDELMLKIFLPFNEMYSLSIMSGSEPLISNAQIIPGSWTPVPYLNDKIIWEADIIWAEHSFKAEMGISILNFAFTDVEAAKQDSNQFYNLTMMGQSPTPAWAFLASFIKGNSITMQDYSRICGERHLRHEERRHSQDHVFTELLLGDTAAADPYKTTLALLKPTSRLYKMIKKLPKERISEINFTAQILIELAGQLGGLIAEMDESISDGRPDLALLSFLDYFNVKEMNTRVQPENIRSSLHFYTAKLFLSGLSELGFEDFYALHSHITKNPRTAHIRARDVIKQLYSLDFWNDTERAEQLSKNHTSISSNEASRKSA